MGPKGAQGRGRIYSVANTTYLLDLFEEVESCGCDEWNEISLKYNANSVADLGKLEAVTI